MSLQPGPVGTGGSCGNAWADISGCTHLDARTLEGIFAFYLTIYCQKLFKLTPQSETALYEREINRYCPPHYLCAC
jgi:hypothetical protein